jgi:glycosidase
MGIAFLLTMRGIPSIYYGTEILMKGFSNPDGWVRMDFKGGWASDSTDKFTEKGRSSVENEGYNYLKKLANWRKNNVAAQQGKLIQFVPEKSVYVYFRKTESQIVMVVMNANDTAMEIKGVRFDEILAGKRTGRNVISEETEQLENIVLKPWEVKVIEL